MKHLFTLCLGTILFGISCGKKTEKSKVILPKNSVEGSFLVQSKAQNSQEQQELESFLISSATQLGCEGAQIKRIDWGEMASHDLDQKIQLVTGGCAENQNFGPQLLEKIQSHPLVDQMEPEAKVRVHFSTPNDPFFSKQYYFDRVGAGAACDKGKSQGNPLVVAVVDTGVDASHPDLQDAFFRNARNEVVGANFVNKGSSRAPDGNWNDQQGHGTHVAGVIAASGNNRQGIMGVAACQGVKIMPVRVLNGQGEGGSLEIERGIKWAADNGANIINLSLGFLATTKTEQAKLSNSLYTQLQRRGIWVVAAAGNESLNNGSFGPADPDFPLGEKAFRYSLPASYDGVISVAATNQTNQLAPFSNYGKFVDVAAPGHQILSTYLGGSYKSLNGTSMASPVFAGSLALALLQWKSGENSSTDGDFPLFNSTNWSQLFQKASSSLPLDSQKVLAGGVLNAEHLVQEVIQLTSSPSSGPTPAVSPVPTALPTQPAISQPFRFEGIAEGGEWKVPKEFKVVNLPGQTKSVLFRFNGRNVEWISVGSSAKEAQTESRYVLRNNGILEAFALNSQGKVLAKVSVTLSP